MVRTCALVIGIVLSLAVVQPHRGAENSEIPDSAESNAFDAIHEALSKARVGGENPSEPDLAARRVAGNETAELARKFLRDFPNSKKAEEAQLLVAIGLCMAARSGDSASASELEKFTSDTIQNPKLSDDHKNNVFELNYITKWVLKTGRRVFNQSTPEELGAWIDAHFAAAEVLADKESILKSVLLLARSNVHNFTDDQRLDMARRILNHPAATEALKTIAKNIIAKKPPYEIGKPIELKFTAIDGREVDVAKMRGKAVMVVFWATWCGPCVAEFPDIKKIYEKYHDKGLEVVGISLDDEKEDLLKFLKKNGPAPWPQYFDGKGWNNEISFRFAIAGVPTVFIIDKNGNLATTNPSITEENVRRFVE